MKSRWTEWCAVLGHVPMSNGRAEIMVGTIKQAVVSMVVESEKESDEVVDKVLFGNLQPPLLVGSSPFYLSFGVKPGLLPLNNMVPQRFGSIDHCEVEILAVLVPRAPGPKDRKRRRKREKIALDFG